MRPDKDKPYYTAYEKRYKSVYAQGADHWLYLPEYEATKSIMVEYVNRFNLNNKKIGEFGCGEGLIGLELVKLGCIYQGYDIAPSAVQKAKTLLSLYSSADVKVFDVVQEMLPESAFDAGIDVGCLHMLVTDNDRCKYLANIYHSLKTGAPMYFVHERWDENAFEGNVSSYEQWLEISGDDVDTAQERTAVKDGRNLPVKIPLIASRPQTRKSYERELTDAGYAILEITEHKTAIDILVKKS